MARLLDPPGARVYPHGKVVASMQRDRQREPVVSRDEALYRRIVETAVEGIWTIDAEARTDFVNPKMAAMLGYTPEEMIGSPLMAFMSEEARAVAAANVERRRQGIAEQHDFEFLRKDGTSLWTTLSTNPILGPDGAYLGALAMVTDITARRDAEQALARTNRRIQATIAALPDLMFELDADARIVGFHAPKADQLYAPPEQFIGRRVGDILPPEAAAVVDGALVEARVHGSHRGAGYALAFPTGERWFELSIVRKEADPGEDADFVAIVRDVTAVKDAERERIQHERKIQHTQKLESLGVLAGGIAHDFNNLLTGILGNTELACLKLPPGSPARPFLDAALDGVTRAATLATQMLAYSGQGRFVVEPIDLSRLTEDLTRLHQVSISKKCQIHFDLMKDLPAVSADAAQLQQVVMNLIINASEALGDAGGIIEARTGVVTCDRAYLRQAVSGETLSEGTYVYLEVSDNGCGMPEATRQRLFDPFFTTKFTGRGLGLSAVLGIVRGHRGAIEVESAPGQGARFRVLLPAGTAAASAPDPARPDASPSGSGGTVLVVDDEAAVLAVVRSMLETMGFAVITAADGRSGVEAFRAAGDRIQLVLLDLTMPDLSGIDVLRAITAIRGDVRAILSSGYDEQQATQGADGVRWSAFLKKPYRYADLVAVVRQAMA